MAPDSPTQSAPAGPLAAYRAQRRAGALQADPMQAMAAEKLQSLHHALAGYEPAGDSGSWKARFGLARRRDEPPQGLYIFGPVGRGKSMLMDLFAETVTVAKRRRVHFHKFMIEVHQRLHAHRLAGGGADPLMAVAAAIADETWLLCFDEFRVVNIVDAIILGRLFEGLFERGVVVVATANIAPQELYKGGRQRARFMQFIALIGARLGVLDIGDGADYRLDRLRGRRVFHHPAGLAATQELDTAFRELTGGAVGEPATLTILGRTLEVPCAAAGVARFTFEELCVRPLGTPDYLAIATHFHTVIVDDIARLDPERRNEAQRLVTLIDALYEHRCNLIASAETAPDEIYPAGDEAFEFRRTASRLAEMQADDYIARPHLT